MARVSAAVALLFLLASPVWPRLEVPPPAIDLTLLIPTAHNIFRGTVVAVSVLDGAGVQVAALAHLKVERWYRGQGGAHASVPFRLANPFRAMGHYCIDFALGTHWLVFAKEDKDGQLELVNDCTSAVAVSRLHGRPEAGSDLLAQMEIDFVAGLDDPDPPARLLGIQRLGGLKRASSRPILQSLISSGSLVEKDWATYAALRCGDTSVLPRVREMLLRGGSEWPLPLLPGELSQLRDRLAIPELIAIADSAPQPSARTSALTALGEYIVAPEALSTLAAHLADPESHVRYAALNGMRMITRHPACTLPSDPRWTEDMVEPQIRQCLAWWRDVGQWLFATLR